MNITIINHGKVFGHENWYTYYCGKCKIQIIAGDTKCKHCDEEIIYPKTNNCRG
jgi:hypothetical protein